MNLTHNEIEGMFFFTTSVHNGDVIKGDLKEPKDETKWAWAYSQKFCDPKYNNLLIAAPAMYQALTKQIGFMQDLIDNAQLQIKHLHDAGIEMNDPTTGMIDIQSYLMMVQSVARDGIEEVMRQAAADNYVKVPK